MNAIYQFEDRAHKPETVDKVKKAERLIAEGLTVKIACMRAQISIGWFHKMTRTKRQGLTA